MKAKFSRTWQPWGILLPGRPIVKIRMTAYDGDIERFVEEAGPSTKIAWARLARAADVFHGIQVRTHSPWGREIDEVEDGPRKRDQLAAAFSPATLQSIEPESAPGTGVIIAVARDPDEGAPSGHE